MQMLLASIQLGGSGATMPPPASEIARRVIDAFVAKDYERAAEIQLQFALFPSKWMHRGLAPAMKAATPKCASHRSGEHEQVIGRRQRAEQRADGKAKIQKQQSPLAIEEIDLLRGIEHRTRAARRAAAVRRGRFERHGNDDHPRLVGRKGKAEDAGACRCGSVRVEVVHSWRLAVGRSANGQRSTAN